MRPISSLQYQGCFYYLHLLAYHFFLQSVYVSVFLNQTLLR